MPAHEEPPVLPGGSFLPSDGDSKGRHQSADWCKKVSGGHFFSPWENPWTCGRIQTGCGHKFISHCRKPDRAHHNIIESLILCRCPPPRLEAAVFPALSSETLWSKNEQPPACPETYFFDPEIYNVRRLSDPAFCFSPCHGCSGRNKHACNSLCPICSAAESKRSLCRFSSPYRHLNY